MYEKIIVTYINIRKNFRKIKQLNRVFTEETEVIPGY